MHPCFLPCFCCYFVLFTRSVFLSVLNKLNQTTGGDNDNILVCSRLWISGGSASLFSRSQPNWHLLSPWMCFLYVNILPFIPHLGVARCLCMCICLCLSISVCTDSFTYRSILFSSWKCVIALDSSSTRLVSSLTGLTAIPFAFRLSTGGCTFCPTVNCTVKMSKQLYSAIWLSHIVRIWWLTFWVTWTRMSMTDSLAVCANSHGTVSGVILVIQVHLSIEPSKPMPFLYLSSYFSVASLF